MSENRTDHYGNMRRVRVLISASTCEREAEAMIAGARLYIAALRFLFSSQVPGEKNSQCKKAFSFLQFLRYWSNIKGRGGCSRRESVPGCVCVWSAETGKRRYQDMT